jgi:hypothetical protein
MDELHSYIPERKHLAFVSVSGRDYPGKVIMW